MGPREGVDAKGRGEARRGRACWVGEGGGRRWRELPWFPPLFPTLLPPPTRQGCGEAPLAGSLEPPCHCHSLAPLVVSQSVPALCAPPSGPWMGKCSAARSPHQAAFAPLPFGFRLDLTRPGSWARHGGRRSGPGKARRRGFRAPPRELQLQRGGPPQPRLPPRGAPVISAPHTLTPGSGGKPGGNAGDRGPLSALSVGEPCPAS